MPQKIIFLTGNANKLREAKEILRGYDVIGKDAEIPEIQEVNPELIVEDKVRRALKLLGCPVFVEDTSLCYESLNGLPGPLVKWFLKKVGRRGLVDILSAFDNKTAYAKCYVGYGVPASGKSKERIMIFEGSVKGRIVEPAGESKFGFDPIFLPDGYDKTFAQMGEEKNKISHRRLALEKLKKYLEGK
jgi:inosine triphosphate pyrophosphatase